MVGSSTTLRHDRLECGGARKKLPARKLRVQGFVLIALLALLSACGVQQPFEDDVRILMRDAAGAEELTLLDTATVSGDVDVLAQTHPDTHVVSFYLDALDGSEGAYVTDDEAPFEFVLDSTKIHDGDHVLYAVAVRQDGSVSRTARGQAHFRVGNSAPQDPTTPGSPAAPGDPVAPGDPSPQPATHAFSLQGNPDFREEDLSDEARRWYRRVWAAIDHPDQQPNADAYARSGSLRRYGYPLQQHMNLLFTALRATGDLRFLDEIARLADIVEDELTTKWYDPSSGNWYNPDDGTAGLRRWLYLTSGTNHHNGKDLHHIGFKKTHAWVAVMAYAFEINRHHTSPGGVDYGEQADFWRDYLLNDFEAIQHIRNGTEPSDDVFRYMEKVGMSVLHSQLTYHYYMHKLTGDPARLRLAEKEADAIAGGMFVVDTPAGDALVFGKPRDPESGLVPIAYTRYTWAQQVDLALDGHPLFSDPAYMAMHARALAHLVMDNGAKDLAFDVGGMKDRTGVSWVDGQTTATLRTQNPYTKSGLEWGRESFNRYATSYMAPLAFFGSHEHIMSITEQAYEGVESDVDNPRRLAIPVGMLLASMR